MSTEPTAVRRGRAGRPSNIDRMSAGQLDRLEKVLAACREAAKAHHGADADGLRHLDALAASEIKAALVRGIRASLNAGASWRQVGEAMCVSHSAAHAFWKRWGAPAQAQLVEQARTDKAKDTV